MDSYTGFAEVYDEFMDNVPYEEWTEYVVSLLHSYGIEDGILLDLGCGTGSMDEILAKQGYDMIGVDRSEEMLRIASEKKAESGSEILYLNQDMTDFELYGTVAAAISICDSVNYLTDEEDLLSMFRLVNNYLDPKGIFIFDLNTPYKYREILGEQTIAEDREDAAFIWDNYFYEDEMINEYQLSIFVKEEDGRYRKYTETHYQRAYELSVVKRLIEEAGMEFLAAYDAFTEDPAREDSERIYVIARESGKMKG